MNALRQFVRVEDDKLSLQVPPEYRNKVLEVILLPVESAADTDSLTRLMDEIGYKAERQGLTPDILQELLNEE